MANLVAAGVNFADITTGFGGGSLAANRYWALNAIGQPPVDFEPQYDDRQVVFPNVDGVGEIRFGFRGRLIAATLVYVGTAANCNAQRKADLDAFKVHPRYTVSLPNGNSFDGCKLISSAPMWGPNIDGFAMCIVPVVWQQKSTTN